MYNDLKSNPLNLFYVAFWMIFVIFIFASCQWIDGLAQKNAPRIVRDETIPQTAIEIYTHYTVWSTQEDGVLWVTNIYVDSTYTGACDSWDKENDEGQNCVLAGNDSIHEFIEYYNLPYTRVVGG
jgi:hypothetical protein